jgi:aspartate racemase
VKTIGIIGGMGPRATADLYMGIVGIMQRRYGARYDADFPPMLIHSVPAPEVVERLEDEAALGALLVDAARGLVAAGADLLAIACNTAHIVYPRVAAAVSVPVLDLPGEAAAAVARVGHGRVGLLATGLTLERGLYRTPCARLGLTLLEPSEAQLEALTGVIMAALAGGDLSAARGVMLGLLGELAAAGADSVLLGCTDLGPVVDGLQQPLPIFDSTPILAEALVREARRGC